MIRLNQPCCGGDGGLRGAHKALGQAPWPPAADQLQRAAPRATRPSAPQARPALGVEPTVRWEPHSRPHLNTCSQVREKPTLAASARTAPPLATLQHQPPAPSCGHLTRPLGRTAPVAPALRASVLLCARTVPSLSVGTLPPPEAELGPRAWGGTATCCPHCSPRSWQAQRPFRPQRQGSPHAN